MTPELELFSNFSKPILEELERSGLLGFTEIQKKAIPAILSGDNVLLVSPTGTGKTEAAILPLIELLLRARSEGYNLRGVSILYITPLRSLNRDIFRRLAGMGERLGIKVEVRHGDTPLSVRSVQAKVPPDLLITTPETLQAILVGRRIREHLKRVRWVVIDEIHELAQDKRGSQLAIALERLQALSGVNFQRIGLSATIGDVELVGRFLAGDGRSCRILKVEAFREMEACVESPSPSDTDRAVAEKFLIPPGVVARLRRLLSLIREHKATLIFTNTREHAESIASKIKMIAPSERVGVHHGSLSKDLRIETENMLKDGRLEAVICTSSLELGIDVGAIDFVVQYMSPRQVTPIVQRIGRSGHAVKGRPRGLVIATWPDDILESAVILRRAFEGLLEEPQLHTCALDVLAHQLVGLVLDHGVIKLEEAYAIVRKSYPYSNLSFEDFERTVKQLDEEGKIRLFNSVITIAPHSSRQYYYENLSMIPDVKQYAVFDFSAKRRVGTLDQEFVARYGKVGSQFILHGHVWQILQVDEERYTIEVEGVEPTAAAIPAWEGEIIPVPFEVAQEVGRLRREIEERLTHNREASDPLSGYSLDEDSRKQVVFTIKKQIEGGYLIAHDRRVVIEPFENYVIIHGCFGDKLNQTLSRILASLLTSKTGLDVAIQSDPYRIALIAPHSIDSQTVKELLVGLDPVGALHVLESTVDQTTLFLWRLWHNAKRFGLVSRDADYRLSHARALLKALRGTPVYQETLREIFLENFDILHLKTVIEGVRSGEVTVDIEPIREIASAFAYPLLDKIAPHDLLQPAKERSEVIELLKSRLEAKTLKLLCVFKGDWEGTRIVRSIPDKVSCPVCGSTLIAVTSKDDEATLKAVRKKLKKCNLSKDEEKLWLTAWKSASIVQNYGRRAVVAMAARGVGPTVAARILRHSFQSEDGFYLAVLKAERNYIRTRMFWD
ncbi:MAG: DEAD/DEAH box helicase [Candidatus Bathyarchaeia archaeon]